MKDFLRHRIKWPAEAAIKLLWTVPLSQYVRWAVISRAPGAFPVKVRGLPHPVWMRGGTSDFAAFREVILFNEYGKHSVPGTVRTVVDCGANIGLSSLFFWKQFPEARIVAVECDSENIEIARKNLAPYDRIALVHAAVWPEAGEIGVDRRSEAWSTRVSESASDKVRAITINQLMVEHALDAIDLLKVDIEGAELELFRGDVSFLDKTRFVNIELHDRFRPGCTAAFTAAARDFTVSHRGCMAAAVNNRFTC